MIRLCTGLLLFVATSAVSGTLLALLLGGLSPAIGLVSLLVGALVGCLGARSTPRDVTLPPDAWDWTLLAVFALASLRAFLWLIYPAGDTWRVLSPNNLGDMALHLHFIRYFASGIPFWPESPILAGVPLTYPIGTDFFNSLLLVVGVPVERGLIWCGLGGAFLTGFFLWRWGRAFGLAALLFNGGIAGFAFFASGVLDDFQSKLAWKNLFLSMFVTQRGLLFALPAGLLLCTTWRREAGGGQPVVPRWIQGILYASLPLFSIHAFLFLSILAAVLFLLTPALRRPLFLLVSACFVPATWLVWLVTGKFAAASSGIRWLPGWMQDGAFFWLLNFGVSLPLLLFLFLRALRDAGARPFVLTSAVTFAACFLFAFAPWEWDNMKLLVWAWLIAAPWLWSLVLDPLPPVVKSGLCALLFFSGAVSLIGGLDGRHGYTLAKRSELAAAAETLAPVQPGERVLITPDYNHPAILLGHPVFCGYEGHLWSHGLDYRQKWAALQDVLTLREGWYTTARGLGVDWVYLDGPPASLVRTSDSTDKPGPPGP